MGMIINPYRFGASSLLTNLVSWWSLNETSGARGDAHGSNSLTEGGTVNSAAAKISLGTSNAGGANYLYKDTSSGLAGRATDYSLSGWVYTTSAATLQAVIGNAWTVSSIDYFLLINTSKLQFYVNQGSTNLHVEATTFGTVPSDTWMHVYCEYNGVTDTIGISVNNGTKNTAAGPASPNTVDNRFSLGYQEPVGRYLLGQMDEWGFWSRLLTTDERTSLYNSGNGIGYPG